MKHIKPIETKPCNNGIQKLYRFRNGYGASVISHEFSYGGKAGKWELAVLAGKDQSLCYSTPITEDVIGWLTPAQVQIKLRAVKALPKHNPPPLRRGNK